MRYLKNSMLCSGIGFFLLFVVSCHNKGKDKALISDPAAMDNRVAEHIRNVMQSIQEHEGKMDDTVNIRLPHVVEQYYSKTGYQPAWCSSEKWLPVADSLYRFISKAEYEGLFPEDYHYKTLKATIDRLAADSLARMDPAMWTRAELLLTDGFMQIIKDLKRGRLQPDSVSLNSDSLLTDQFYISTRNMLAEKNDLAGLLNSIQPKHKKYWALKQGIKQFVDSMNRKVFTHIKYPFKRGDSKDSLYFIKTLQKRLSESNCMDGGNGLADSARLANGIKKYQVQKGLQADGRFGNNLITALNGNDVEKFKRIAITLDRFKQLPAKMPAKYIWVNIPACNLQLMDADTVVFESKVIIGKPETRTPLLTSAISNIITYPTWTVPNSIIVKQYLPKLKNNPNYISRIGLQLINHKGEVVDPNTVNWSKYSKGIPYKIMQGSGDNNSLGVIKFNFDNPYSVYLHDTNQRYLFKRASRALSHGCVRVQEWEKLAFYIASNDSALLARNDSLQYSIDSIRNWISKKELHRVNVKNHIPLYIRYFTCEGKNGVIRFYDDIYGEDKQLLEKYFAKK